MPWVIDSKKTANESCWSPANWIAGEFATSLEGCHAKFGIFLLNCAAYWASLSFITYHRVHRLDFHFRLQTIAADEQTVVLPRLTFETGGNRVNRASSLVALVYRSLRCVVLFGNRTRQDSPGQPAGIPHKNTGKRQPRKPCLLCFLRVLLFHQPTRKRAVR